MSPEPARPNPPPAPAAPARYLRPVYDLRPGDRIARTVEVTRVIRTATAVEVTTSDGAVTSYPLAQDTSVVVEL